MGNEMLKAIHRWDVTAFQRIISSEKRNTLRAYARAISMTGDGWPYFLVPAVLYFLGMPSIVEFVVVGGIAFAIERVVYKITKNSFKRRRPANALSWFDPDFVASDEFSFPSGHASAAFLMTSLLVLFYGPMLLPLYVWSSLVAASRVVLGVHFPTDVLVGAAMGILLASLTYSLI